MPNEINLDISQRVDITCRKGDSFVLDLDITDENGLPKNISGYTFKMEVRSSDTSTGGETDADVILTTSDTDNSSNKQIVVSTPDASGNVTFTSTAANMALTASGLYVYDIQANSGTVVTTWLHGLFKINEDVSI